jgi:hypothetical protein
MRHHQLTALIQSVISDILSNPRYIKDFSVNDELIVSDYYNLEVSGVKDISTPVEEIKVAGINYQALGIKRNFNFEHLIEEGLEEEYGITLVLLNSTILNESVHKKRNMITIFLDDVLENIVEDLIQNGNTSIGPLMKFGVRTKELSHNTTTPLYIIYFDDKHWGKKLDSFLYSKQYGKLQDSFENETGYRVIFTSY